MKFALDSILNGQNNLKRSFIPQDPLIDMASLMLMPIDWYNLKGNGGTKLKLATGRFS